MPLYVLISATLCVAPAVCVAIQADLLSAAQMLPLLHNVLQTMLTPAVADLGAVLHTVLIADTGNPGSTLLLLFLEEQVCRL
jgi:hypothetical protein